MLLAPRSAATASRIASGSDRAGASDRRRRIATAGRHGAGTRRRRDDRRRRHQCRALALLPWTSPERPPAPSPRSRAKWQATGADVSTRRSAGSGVVGVRRRLERHAIAIDHRADLARQTLRAPSASSHTNARSPASTRTPGALPAATGTPRANRAATPAAANAPCPRSAAPSCRRRRSRSTSTSACSFAGYSSSASERAVISDKRDDAQGMRVGARIDSRVTGRRRNRHPEVAPQPIARRRSASRWQGQRRAR